MDQLSFPSRARRYLVNSKNLNGRFVNPLTTALTPKLANDSARKQDDLSPAIPARTSVPPLGLPGRMARHRRGLESAWSNGARMTQAGPHGGTGEA